MGHQPHHHHDHGHTHQPADHPGHFHERERPLDRNFNQRAFTVGADLKVMERDTKRMRGDGPFVFAQVKNGMGCDEIVAHQIHAWQHTLGRTHTH